MLGYSIVTLSGNFILIWVKIKIKIKINQERGTMNTIAEIQDIHSESHDVTAFSVEIDGNDDALKDDGTHILYSRGHLLDGMNYFQSLQKIAELTRRNPQEVEELVLSGQRKKMRSSNSLKNLILLEAKFKELGLDVYIESEQT